MVEDQEDEAPEILRDLLGNAGYELTEAENGEEAIAAVAARRPDLILMDIQLPIMDGYEEPPGGSGPIRPEVRTKIIAVTSYALAGDESKALEAGCNSYVSKPYSPREVLAKVRAYLGLNLTERFSAASLNHLVGAGEQHRWHLDAGRLGQS